MATPTPKSRQSKSADPSQESHGSSVVIQQHSKAGSESSKSSQAAAVEIASPPVQTQAAAVDVVELKQLVSKSPADSRSRTISEKSAPQHPVERPEPAPRERHQQDRTPSQSSNATERGQNDNHSVSEGATRTSRRSAGGEEKPTAAPRSQSRRQSPEKRSSSALLEGNALADLQHPPTESGSAVMPAWQSSSGRTTSRDVVSREPRSETDRGPFSSTPSQHTLSSENEGFAGEKREVSSKLRASKSSDTAKAADTLESSSAGEPPSEPPPAEPSTAPPTEERYEEAQSKVPHYEEQTARIPSWKRLLVAPKNRPTDERIKKEVAAPPPLPLSAKDTNSFAYKTVRDRLPVILTKVIDTVFRDRMDIERVLGPEAREETKAVVGRLAKLRNEMLTNKPMICIEDDFEDAEIWNSVLHEYTSKNGCTPRWYEAPWLYIETYFYRRIFEAFQLTTKLRDYDPFSKLKRDALYGSFNAVRALCDFLRWNTPRDAALETLQQTTYRLLEVSLWGNRCDLSLSCGADSSTLAGSLQLTERLRPYIISNHADQLLQHLCRLRARNLDGETIKLHYVLDNSGYELATDLVLLDFLHETQYVSTVIIHAKAIPWYVSDVMRRDLFWTLRELEDSDHAATQALGERCQRRIMEGAWYVMDDIFWTQSFDYAEMATRRPELYELLRSADLLLFKGDLNYRKLVGDLSWNPTVPFKQALRGFEPTFVCALRTMKADTVAGIDPVTVSEVVHRSPDWMVTGDYAVIQCAGVEHAKGPSLVPTPEIAGSPKKSSTVTPVRESGTSASVHTAVSVHQEQSSDMHQEARGSSGAVPERASSTGVSGTATAVSATAGSRSAVSAAAAASSSTGQEPAQQSTTPSSVPDDTKKRSGTSCSEAKDALPQRSD
ncbi:hypothetical protein HPB50_020246 [Hyalomma asiaticum]|uniref:Uncharacterized protein n=1 Tax=Hyalomma asiaticum TaxID=266040 RepID=A0ACB7SYG1_HYAAI|nr:hypothetical protein HPB50_020246 [Hyalomma asiaticum]